MQLGCASGYGVQVAGGGYCLLHSLTNVKLLPHATRQNLPARVCKPRRVGVSAKWNFKTVMKCTAALRCKRVSPYFMNDLEWYCRSNINGGLYTRGAVASLSGRCRNAPPCWKCTWRENKQKSKDGHLKIFMSRLFAHPCFDWRIISHAHNSWQHTEVYDVTLLQHSIPPAWRRNFVLISITSCEI